MANWNSIDIFEEVVASFYVLEATILELEQRKDKDTRYTQLLRKATMYRTRFHRGLARTLRDSIIGMCFGEARHAKHVARIPVVGEAKDESYRLIRGYRQDRNDVYGNLHKFAPSDVLRVKEVFERDGWDGSFGGKNWAKLCEEAMKYDIMPPTIFCDHIFHVVHNGGCAFSKGFLICYKFAYKVQEVLNEKFEGDVTSVPEKIYPDSIALAPTVHEIYEKTRYLIYIHENTIFGSSKFKVGKEPLLRTVKWNDKPNLVIVDDEDFEPNHNGEDDYYGEEQEMEEMDTQVNTRDNPYVVREVSRRKHVDFR